MARGLDDLSTARDLAERAAHAARQQQYAEAMALSSVGHLYIELARLSVEVLASSAPTEFSRAWRDWQVETGVDTR